MALIGWGHGPGTASARWHLVWLALLYVAIFGQCIYTLGDVFPSSFPPPAPSIPCYATYVPEALKCSQLLLKVCYVCIVPYVVWLYEDGVTVLKRQLVLFNKNVISQNTTWLVFQNMYNHDVTWMIKLLDFWNSCWQEEHACTVCFIFWITYTVEHKVNTAKVSLVICITYVYTIVCLFCMYILVYDNH